MATSRRCAPSGALTDRERLWAAMREMGVFTQRDLLRAVNRGCSRDDELLESTSKDYLRGLEMAGFLSVKRGKKNEAHVYTVALDSGVRAPRVRKDGSLLPESGRMRMWKAMQVLGEFSVSELTAAASLDTAKIAPSEARSYCQWLARGGYLQGMQSDRYRMIRARYTGAKAPQILRTKQLYDPNTDKVAYATRPEGRDDL